MSSNRPAVIASHYKRRGDPDILDCFSTLAKTIKRSPHKGFFCLCYLLDTPFKIGQLDTSIGGGSGPRNFPSLDRACLGFNQEFIDGVDVSKPAGLDGVHSGSFSKYLAVAMTHVDGHFALRVLAAGF